MNPYSSKDLDLITALPEKVKEHLKRTGLKRKESIYHVFSKCDISDIISDEDKQKVLDELCLLISSDKRKEIDEYVPEEYAMGLIEEEDA